MKTQTAPPSSKRSESPIDRISPNVPSQQKKKLDQFARTLRLLSKEVLGTSRYQLVLEGPLFLLVISPQEQFYFDFTGRQTQEELTAMSENIRQTILGGKTVGMFFRNILVDKDSLSEDDSIAEFDDSLQSVEIKSRLPFFNYLTDQNAKRKIEKYFGSKSGDARNLFMEIAREEYTLKEIQNFLELTDDAIEEMVTWGIEEELLYIRSDASITKIEDDPLSKSVNTE